MSSVERSSAATSCLSEGRTRPSRLSSAKSSAAAAVLSWIWEWMTRRAFASHLEAAERRAFSEDEEEDDEDKDADDEDDDGGRDAAAASAAVMTAEEGWG